MTTGFGYGQVEKWDEMVVRARTEAGALAALYERYYPRILRYCQRRLFVREVAEDITSAVFCQVAEHIPTFNGSTEQAFRNWLYAIATNQSNSHIRKTVRRRELMQAAMAERGRMETDSPVGDDMDWPTVYEAIAALKPRQQAVVTLRFFEEMPFTRIAEILNCRPVTVRVTCSRALAILRKKLGRSLAEQWDKR